VSFFQLQYADRNVWTAAGLPVNKKFAALFLFAFYL